MSVSQNPVQNHWISAKVNYFQRFCMILWVPHFEVDPLLCTILAALHCFCLFCLSSPSLSFFCMLSSISCVIFHIIHLRILDFSSNAPVEPAAFPRHDPFLRWVVAALTHLLNFPACSPNATCASSNQKSTVGICVYK